MNELAHKSHEAVQYLGQYKECFTSRCDGSSWPNHRTTWIRATQYVRGLVRTGTDKSMAGIASKSGVKQEKMERFVRESAWEYDKVMEQLGTTVPDEADGPDAALILDGMGIPKQGDDSVGVGRQWCGATGKVDNCQVTVNLTIATAGEQRNADQVSWPLGMRLYLPKKWVGHDQSVYDSLEEQQLYAERRAATGIPDDIEYQSKQEIGGDMVAAAVERDPEFGCVLGDSAFGKSPGLRRRLRALGTPYALEVPPSKFPVVAEETPLEDVAASEPTDSDVAPWTVSEDADIVTPTDLAQTVADGETDAEWDHIDWAEGTKETLSGEFYRTRVRVVTDRDDREVGEETGWLVLEKTADGTDDQEGDVSVKAWMCWGLDEESLEELVERTHLRWPVERFHQDIKQHLGADEFQGRSWDGFHRHLAVVMLGHSFIAKQRLEVGRDAEELPSFEEVLRRIVREAGIQQLMAKLDFDRQTAAAAAEEMLQGFTDWRIPDI